MTKAELVTMVAEKADLTKKDAEKAISALVESISETLAKGRKRSSSLVSVHLKFVSVQLVRALTPVQATRSRSLLLRFPLSRQAVL